ncbi:hypothetical protein FOL47_005293 [Perkinsus chesapeaki]|uniref:Uncharacterized protein n=1 Tax=Perkinsus chesapeaki TaxID=330153 RepID=A0A7J6LXV5_PERCH|nr:hypothetical protein FOL47_005293 [Perkinsus chesapeaki]
MKRMVRGLTRAATGSGHRRHDKSSSHHQPSEQESTGELLERTRRLEEELAAAKDTVEVQKEQLDKSLVEYTSALQRIVSLEKALESMKEVQDENEHLQERVLELIYEEQDKGPSVVITQTFGDISIEEAARLLDGENGTHKERVPTEGADILEGVDYSKLILIEDPAGSSRKWYGEAGLQDLLRDLRYENEQLKTTLSPSKDASEDVNCQISQPSQLHRQIAELEQDAKYLADRERLAAKQHAKEKATLLEKIAHLEAAASRCGACEASTTDGGLPGKRARTANSADTIEDLEGHILTAIEEHLTRRENHLDRALGFTIASRMLQTANSEHSGETSWETIAEKTTRLRQLEQEVEIKTKLCDQLALRLADSQSIRHITGLSEKAHLHAALL